MMKFLIHYFYPHESNNYRARLLHHKSILFLIIFLFIGGFALSFLRNNFSSVLGISSNITYDELLLLTNSQRQANGLAPLSLNQELSNAAAGKAIDMFSENYWAHESPSGKTPWIFIKNAGYNYVYAGENLARGFTNTTDVINAWMASPTHKKNILSPNYKEIGFAVNTGVLNGEETVLVVEMFGSRELAQVPQETKKEIESSLVKAEEQPSVQNVAQVAGSKLGAEIKRSSAQINSEEPLIDSINLSSNIAKTIIILLILVLLLDMIVIERRKLVRFVGHNIDHILFLGLLLIMIGILTNGIVI